MFFCYVGLGCIGWWGFKICYFKCSPLQYRSALAVFRMGNTDLLIGLIFVSSQFRVHPKEQALFSAYLY